MSFRTAKARVTGLGAAHGGTHHFWTQNLSSVALIPLTILFLIPLAPAIGSGYEDVRALYASPFHAIVAILFIGVAFHHHAQGLQIVIEDYVPNKGWRTALLVGNALFCATAAIAGIFAVLKIAFGG